MRFRLSTYSKLYKKIMKNNLEQFCSALGDLQPNNSDHLVADLYDIVELLDNEKNISSIYEPVFNFLETYPEEDVGNPGPLVHLIERNNPEHIPRLVHSIKQKPTYMCVIMLSRVLNSNLSQEDYSHYLSLIKTVSESDSVDEIIKENAKEVYDFQIENNS